MPTLQEVDALRQAALELGKQYQAAVKDNEQMEQRFRNEVAMASASDQPGPPRWASLDASGAALSQLQAKLAAADKAYSSANGAKSFADAFGTDTKLKLGNVGGFGLSTQVTRDEYDGDTNIWSPISREVWWKYDPATKTWALPGTDRKVAASEVGLGGYSGGDLTAALVPLATRAGQNTDEWSIERMSRLPAGSTDDAVISEVISALPEWMQANKPRKDFLDRTYDVMDVVAPILVGGMLTAGFGAAAGAALGVGGAAGATQAGMLATQEVGFTAGQLAGWGGATTSGAGITGGALVGTEGALSSGTGNRIIDAALNNALRGGVTSAVQGGDPITGALTGAVSGGLQGAGGVTGITGVDAGSPLLNKAINSAGSGAILAGVTGRDPVTGALNNVVNTGVNALGSAANQALAGAFDSNEAGAPSAPDYISPAVEVGNWDDSSYLNNNPSTVVNQGTGNMSDLWDIYDTTGGDSSYLNYTSPDYSLAGGNADLGYLGLDTGNFTNSVDSYDANTGGVDWGNIFGDTTGYGLNIPADSGNTTWDASNPLGITNTNGGLGFGDPSIGGSNITIPGVNTPSGSGAAGSLTGLLAAISKAGTPVLQALGLGQGGTNNGVLANLLAAYQSNKNTNSTQALMEKLINLSDPFASQRPQYQSKLAALMNDPNAIANTPAYKFDMEQGLNAVNSNAAAKGQLTSGNRLFDLTKFGQGLASKEYNNQVATLSGLAGANIAPQNIASTVATTQQGINSSSNSTLANLFNAVNSAAGANPSTIPKTSFA